MGRGGALGCGGAEGIKDEVLGPDTAVPRDDSGNGIVPSTIGKVIRISPRPKGKLATN